MYIVTGASSGLGREVVKELLSSELHISVVGVSRRNPSIDHDFFKWIKMDQSDWQSTEQAVSQILAMNMPIKGIIHCAGILNLETFDRLSENESQVVMNTNVIGLAHLQGLLMASIKKKGASTIVVTSTAVFKPLARQPLYAASQAARQALALSFRDELSDYEDAPVHIVAPRAMQPSGMARPKPGKKYIDSRYVASCIVHLLKSFDSSEQDIVINRRKAASIE